MKAEVKVEVGQVWESVRNGKAARVVELREAGGIVCAVVETRWKAHLTPGSRYVKWLAVGRNGIKGYRLRDPQ